VNRQWPHGTRTLLVGVAIIVGAFLPLLVYGAIEKINGTSGGNPVGLGLLEMLGQVAGLVFIVVVASEVSRSLARRRDKL
jgi:hypothetical protein